MNTDFIISKDEGLAFILNDENLKNLKSIKQKNDDNFSKFLKNIHKNRLIQQQLLKNLVWYGFSFTTCYDLTELGKYLRSELSKMQQDNCSKSLQQQINKKSISLIHTSISLDADSMNQISCYCYDCLDQGFYQDILTIHYWLINQLLRNFRQQIKQELNVCFRIIERILLISGLGGLFSTFVFQQFLFAIFICILGWIYSILRQKIKKWMLNLILGILMKRRC